jgi:CxxC-x17-CxxC domain-containing protein
LKNEPKRCKPCKRKKNERIVGSQTLSRERVEVGVSCASCGSETTVPFRPTQGRPVYCRACFLKMREPAVQAQAPVH